MKKILALALAFCFVIMFTAEAYAAKPVITKQPESATTTKSGSVTFSVKASGSISAYSWFFVNPKTGKKISGKKLPKSVKGVKVTGPNRSKITLSKVPESMHGWLVYCTVGGGGYKVDSEYATLLVYGMDPPEAITTTALEITKQPKDTAITEERTLTFAVTYSGLAEKITWAFINPKDGSKVIGKNILKKFKTLKVSGINKAKLKLTEVPDGMVGWKVYAHLKGKGVEIDTEPVSILAVGTKAKSSKKDSKKKTEDTKTEAKAEEKADTKAETKAETQAEAAAATEEQADRHITVTCSDKVLRALNDLDQVVGDEPVSKLEFINLGSFVVTSDKPIRNWTLNGIINEPTEPVHEFRVTNVTEDLTVIITYGT